VVGRSYDRTTNKALREEAVPMAAELVPFLRWPANAARRTEQRKPESVGAAGRDREPEGPAALDPCESVGLPVRGGRRPALPVDSRQEGAYPRSCRWLRGSQ
jgi:hypothetical protein